MGNGWFELEGIFHGYAMEELFGNWGAMVLGAGLAPEGKVGRAHLSRGPGQPQDRLQVVEAVYGWRPAGFAGPIAPAAADATTDAKPLGGSDPATATSAAPLGPKEIAGGLAAALGARSAGRSNDWAVVAALGNGASGATLSAPGVRVAAATPERRTATQPGVDG